MIAPPLFSLFLFGLSGLIALLTLGSRASSIRIGKRVLSLIAARFGEPVPYPPPQVLRAFHRGESLVVLTVHDEAETVSVHPVLEIASC